MQDLHCALFLTFYSCSSTLPLPQLLVLWQMAVCYRGNCVSSMRLRGGKCPCKYKRVEYSRDRTAPAATVCFVHGYSRRDTAKGALSPEPY
jgi:hypothetical protein